jgi:hypothetical protein
VQALAARLVGLDPASIASASISDAAGTPS